MQSPQMENPALAARGVPVFSLAAGKIDPESNRTVLNLQAAAISRRCAISIAMAAIVAPFAFGECAR